jgi:raffinose/stachyose/melibiose transport system substrate-binding protein
MVVSRDLQATRLSRRRLAALFGGLSTLSLVGGRRPSAVRAQDNSISIWDNRSNRQLAWEQIEALFREQRLDVDIEYQVVPFSDYLPKLQTAMVSGSGPDVIGFVEGQWIRNFRDEVVNLVDWSIADGMIPPARDQVAFDDGVWGCPLASYTLAVYYNRGYFGNLGLEPPRNWDELYTVCDTFLGSNTTPLLMPGSYGSGLYFTYMLAASSILGPDGLAQLADGGRSLTDSDVLEAAHLLRGLEPYYNKDYASTDYATAVSRFAGGEAAMVIAGSDFFTGENAIQSGFDLGVFGFPPYANGENRVTATGMDLIYAAGAKSDQVETATEFVVWLASEDAQRLIAETVGLPVHAGVTPSEGIAAETVAVRQGGFDFLVWYDTIATGNTYVIGSDALVRLMSGEITAEDAAAMIEKERALPA